MKKNKKIIIVGDGAFAEVAYEYFNFDSEFEVVAFGVENEFITQQKKFNLPVIPLEKIDQRYSPEDYYFFVALVYNEMNRLRTRLYNLMISKGFKAASYISSKAIIWKNVKIGEHCFIFEGNNIQPFVEIGNNVILWSGNHIGHHSSIEDNCFISSHVVISGFCHIKSNCFFGVNSTIADQCQIAKDCFIGANAIILKNTTPQQVISPKRTMPSEVNSLRLFKVKVK
jgi:sugar O-acyltransferase (sialic acid O-acetyltransferase NeuD family)